MRYLWCTLLLSFITASGFSQEEGAVEEFPNEPPSKFKHSIKIGGGLPFIVAPENLKKMFDGTYFFNGSTDFNLYKGITLGLGGTFALLDNSDLRSSPVVIKSKFYEAGLRLGYLHLNENNFFVFSGIESGYSKIAYQVSYSTADTVTQLPNFEQPYMSLFTGIGYIIEGRKSVGLGLGYKLLNHRFNPAIVNKPGGPSDVKFQYLSAGVYFIQGF